MIFLNFEKKKIDKWKMFTTTIPPTKPPQPLLPMKTTTKAIITTSIPISTITGMRIVFRNFIKLNFFLVEKFFWSI